MNALRPALYSIAALLFVSTTASAASYEHVDRLALRLQSQSRALGREVSRHYRHAAHLGHLIGDTRKIARLSRHIHEVSHRSGNPVHLQNDLTAIDRSLHHFERVLAKIRHNASHGAGHPHGRTRHVDSLVHTMKETIQHLQTDIHELTQQFYYRNSRPSNHHRQTVHRSSSHGGVAIRTGHFSFRIGF